MDSPSRARRLLEMDSMPTKELESLAADAQGALEMIDYFDTGIIDH
jgi:hypothetical protein